MKKVLSRQISWCIWQDCKLNVHRHFPWWALWYYRTPTCLMCNIYFTSMCNI